jgi:hypothetical protein
MDDSEPGHFDSHYYIANSIRTSPRNFKEMQHTRRDSFPALASHFHHISGRPLNKSEVFNFLFRDSEGITNWMLGIISVGYDHSDQCIK